MAEPQNAQLRNRRKTDQEEKVRGVRIRALNVIAVLATCAIAIVLLVSIQSIQKAYSEFESASDNYIQCETAANSLREASNFLVAQARSYAVTHKQMYILKFSQEISSMRRENAVKALRDHMSGGEAVDYLEESLGYSEQLMKRELLSMYLVADGLGQSLAAYGDLFSSVQLTAEEEALSPEEKIEKGVTLVFDDDYQKTIDLIGDRVARCKAALISDVSGVRDANAQTMRALLLREQLLIGVFVVVVIALILAIGSLALRPLRMYIDKIGGNEALPMKGAFELRFLAQAYNILRDENMRTHDSLLRRAERDHLTDLYNRSVFEKSIDMHQSDPIALLLIDADYFKNINDTLGHDAGDAMLKKIASLLMSSFRITDYPCRIGGDEFAVIMAEVTPDLEAIVIDKIEKVRQGLRDTADGLPEMTVSVGIAFSDGSLNSDELYKNADKALYKVKEAGRDGYAFFEG